MMFLMDMDDLPNGYLINFLLNIDGLSSIFTQVLMIFLAGIENSLYRVLQSKL